MAVSLISWNMNQNRVRADGVPWEFLPVLAEQVGAAVALVQEAPRPRALRAGTVTIPARDSTWAIPIPSDANRSWCSGIVVFDPVATPVEPIEAPSLTDAASGAVAASHPGQFAAAVVTLDGRPVTLISLYGLWEAFDGDIYAVRSLHRAIADLAPLLASRGPLVVAGDLNVWRGVGQWKRRYQTVFDMFDAYGFACAGPGTATEPVPTYRTVAGNPKQTDFVFAKGAAVEVRVGDVGPSDHLPVLITLHG